jgi:hypothetical protein
VEITRSGQLVNAGSAPYLDYSPPTDTQKLLLHPLLEEQWLGDGLERKATEHAIRFPVPEHLREVRTRREALVDKTLEQVQARLLGEIRHWDQRANDLRLREEAGRFGDKLNSTNARKRADELNERLQKRRAELAQERQVSARPPTVLGGALVVPMGWLAAVQPTTATPILKESPLPYGPPDREVERLAMEAVIAFECALGFEPRDVSQENRGYDIESRYPVGHAKSGQLRFIEVKGRAAGAETVSVTKNEILTALNKPDDFILAIVFVESGQAAKPCYLERPFDQEPDFATASVTFHVKNLIGIKGKLIG